MDVHMIKFSNSNNLGMVTWVTELGNRPVTGYLGYLPPYKGEVNRLGNLRFFEGRF